MSIRVEIEWSSIEPLYRDATKCIVSFLEEELRINAYIQYMDRGIIEIIPFTHNEGNRWIRFPYRNQCTIEMYSPGEYRTTEWEIVGYLSEDSDAVIYKLSDPKFCDQFKEFVTSVNEHVEGILYG